MLRVVDGYGREIFVTRQQWRDNILVNNIKQQWDNPDALFSIIVSSLEDGFLSDVIDAARHLHEIDPIPLRGANIYGVVLMEEGRLDEAEQVFQNYLKQHEEAGIVFVNLAKIAAKRGDTAKADEFLWKGLQLDPNQDHGFMWYMSKQKESGTPTAEEDALRRIAALPQSWRAQLWLARKALDQRDLDAAMSLYQESLSRAGSPVPGDLLMQMSGDLGNRAHLLELVQLLDPNFNARFHGMQVGNNLIKAHIDLGQLEEAARILNELHAMKRPDWGPALSFWDSQLAKARISTAPQATPEEMQITLLTIEGPAVWLKSTSPATELFPVETKSGSVVAFVGGSAEQPSKEGEAGMQAKLSDWLGRLTRAIPLYLSEQIAFSTASDVRTLIPWMIEPTEAFVVLGQPIPDEAAAGQARDAAKPADYVVVSHLGGQSPWTLEARLIRTIDAKRLATVSVSVTPEKLFEELPNLVNQLLTALKQEAEISEVPVPANYDFPANEQLATYLLRLEQLLALRCSALDEELAKTFLHNEREIIHGCIHLCLAAPQSVTARLLLAHALGTLREVRPEVPREFVDGLRMLQGQYPLPAPANGMVQRLFAEALIA